MSRPGSGHEAARPALVVRGLGRRFGALQALRDVDLHLEAGERRAILGPNGAGKTTLFNVVTGDLPASQGVVELFGQDVTRLGAHERARLGVSRTYQNALLFEGLTVGENLYLAVRGKRPRRLSLRRSPSGAADRQAAARIAADIGLDDRFDVEAGSLGHGDQRQLELGMALAGRPSLLMLDEPAAGLGAGERARLARLLAEVPRSVTMLLIEHDVDLALQAADRVTVMHQGTVLLEGTPEEIRRSERVHDVYLGRQHD